MRNGERSLTAVGWASRVERCPNCLPANSADSLSDHLSNIEQSAPANLALDRFSLPTHGGKDIPYFYDPEIVDEDSHDGPSAKSAAVPDDNLEPWTIPESVFFVYKTIVTSDGKAHRIPSATAFVIGVPELSHRTFVRFLVTARHVVDPEWAHCSEKNPRSIDIRLNRRSGGVGYETLALQNDRVPAFLTPSDGTSDLAVIRLDQHPIPHLEAYKIFDTPFRLLPTDSELQAVHSDQQIMTAGLLIRPAPEASNYPISHGGVLSGNATKAVTMQCNTAQASTELHVWFINAAIPQGVSGAPVFTSMTREIGGGKTPVLLGIQAVAWPDRGIAGMTPSSVLSDLIHQALEDPKLRMDFSKGSKP